LKAEDKDGVRGYQKDSIGEVGLSSYRMNVEGSYMSMGPPTPGTTPKASKHAALGISQSKPTTHRPLTMGHKAFDFEEMTSSPVVPPPTHRPKLHGMKSFDFDDTATTNDTNNDAKDIDAKDASPGVRMSIDDEDYEVLPPSNNEAPRPNNVPSFQNFYNRSRSNSISSTGSNTIGNVVTSISDESPRIIIPPHKLPPPEGWGSSTGSGNTPRPHSVERRRWLARVSLLGYKPDGRSQEKESQKIEKLAKDDNDAADLAVAGKDKYINLEYLEWMGRDVLRSDIDKGDITCHRCSKTIGCWNWNPSDRICLDGLLEPPIIRIHKSIVQQADVMFDATPVSTPRDLDITPR